MFNMITKFVSFLFMVLGELGSSHMCFGFLHEVEVPEELKDKS